MTKARCALASALTFTRPGTVRLATMRRATVSMTTTSNDSSPASIATTRLGASQ
jgi:hypothetical protein